MTPGAADPNLIAGDRKTGGVEQCVVITTIHARSEAMARLQTVSNQPLVIVGDVKTPAYEAVTGSIFLSVGDQMAAGLRLAELLPLNHYSRKNIGYLWAMRQGCRTIYETDDDNLPYDDWEFPDFLCRLRCVNRQRFVNVYRYFTDELIWPRGYPLDEARDGKGVRVDLREPCRIGVWQGLADGDPDVDAVYRLLYPGSVVFERKEPVALDAGCYCPFNSQNTLWAREAFAYLYLPTTVSFRFTDILRGYVAQRALWQHKLHVGFTRPTVRHTRNEHDVLQDFRAEVECMVGVKNLVGIMESLDLGEDAFQNLRTTYEALASGNIVAPAELPAVDAWVADCREALGDG